MVFWFSLFFIWNSCESYCSFSVCNVSFSFDNFQDYLFITRPGFYPWVWKIPWRRKWQPTPVFLPGKSYGQRSLVGYSPWGRTFGHDWATCIYIYIYMNGQGEPACTGGQGTWPNPCGSFVQSSTTWWPRCHRHDLLTGDGLGCMVAWIPRKV